MAEYLVRNADELSARIAQAEAGDTIYLAAGIYDPIIIRNLGELGITLASQDADNPAILTGLIMSDTSSVRFSNIIFEADVDDTNVFQFSDTSSLVFSGIVVRGPDNIGSGLEASPFMIRSSSDITIVDSEFYNLFHAIKLLEVNGVVISGNDFHDIRTDGIRGGGVSNAVVTGNYFTDFYPIGNDHPDAIQFWSTNQDQPGVNLVISDNLVVRGNGAPTQGVFIRDTHDNMPFENVTVTGNVVLGGLYNGISIDGVIGGEVTNNIVIGYPDQRSWIRVNMDTFFDVSENAATAYSFDTRDSAHIIGNREIAEDVDFYSQVVSAWQASGEDLAALSSRLLDAAVYEGEAVLQSATAQADEHVSLTGTWAEDQLEVGDGGSWINAKAGDDVLLGGRGSDVMYGAWGNDYLAGGEGSDKLDGGGGDDIILGGLGNDRIFGGNGHDKIDGGLDNDFLFGAGGSDTLVGGAGADKLNGGGGHDILFGGEGDDILIGEWGDDQLIGGLGKDLFLYYTNHGGLDTILDFERGSDKIALAGMDANTNTLTNDAFTFINSAAFSNTAGELRVELLDNGVMVQGDTDGDGIADFQLMVEGVDVLSSTDFFL